MVIKVNPKQLRSVFTDFVKNKTLFNFKTDGKTLDIQVLENYTVTTSMPVESVDGDFKETDISFWVTKCIHVLNDEDDIKITINEAALVIEQGAFNCVMLREYEARRELPTLANVELKPAYAKRLKYITHAGVSCMCMARELSIADPDPVFVNEKCYFHYNQAALIAGIRYPQMSIPFSTLRSFSYHIGEDAVYAYLAENETFYIESQIYKFWIPVINYNINNNVVKTLDNRLEQSTEITKLTIKDYRDKFAIIADAFPKQKLQVAIGDGTISISASANNYNVMVGSKINNPLALFMITSAELSAISKLFDEDEISVRKGVGCVCLMSSDKVLLIAATVY